MDARTVGPTLMSTATPGNGTDGFWAGVWRVDLAGTLEAVSLSPKRRWNPRTWTWDGVWRSPSISLVRAERSGRSSSQGCLRGHQCPQAIQSVLRGSSVLRQQHTVLSVLPRKAMVDPQMMDCRLRRVWSARGVRLRTACGVVVTGSLSSCPLRRPGCACYTHPVQRWGLSTCRCIYRHRHLLRDATGNVEIGRDNR